MIGQTLDKRYKIIRKLGSGGFGEAFLAKDISLHGIFCVVKQLKPIDKSEQVLKIARRLFASLTGGGIPPEVGLNRLTNNRLSIVFHVFLSFIPLVANIISWGIASKIMDEKILAGVVFPKGDSIEQILVLIQPMSQVAIYGIMMSAAMVMFIKFPESERN
jgi:serine/threonine protein kinase